MIREGLKRRYVVVGACTGTDAHTVGLDAILSMKGFAGDKGLEYYTEMEVHNLGSQVTPHEIVDTVRATRADAVLISQVVTQRDAHIHHLREVRERAVAYDECESNDAVNCAAAPVYDRAGAMVAAMSISVPTFRWNDQVRREWSELVSGGAAKLSQRLGHTPARHREPA